MLYVVGEGKGVGDILGRGRGKKEVDPAVMAHIGTFPLCFNLNLPERIRTGYARQIFIFLGVRTERNTT